MSEKQPRMQVRIADDRSTAAVEFLPASGATGTLTLRLDQLDGLIGFLGKIRAQMAEGQPIPPPEEAQVNPVFNTRWYIHPEPMTEGALLRFAHPAFGAVAFLVPRHELPEMVRLLQENIDIQWPGRAKPN